MPFRHNRDATWLPFPNPSVEDITRPPMNRFRSARHCRIGSCARPHQPSSDDLTREVIVSVATDPLAAYRDSGRPIRSTSPARSTDTGPSSLTTMTVAVGSSWL